MKRIDVLSFAMLAGSAALTVALWDRLPDPFPIHFDAHGVANGWAPRAWGALSVPVIGALTFALVRFVTPRFGSARASVGALALVAASLAVFFALVQVAILGAITHAFALARSLPLLVGGLWLTLGLIFPKIRRNPFVGFRTAWSMASDENWARTHRAVSPFMVFGGATAVVAALVGIEAALPVALAAILATAVLGTVASYVVARR